MSPSQFQQLYVIRAPHDTSAVFCVYALLSRKSQTVYETLLKAVVDKCDAMSYRVDPTTVVCDFEQATINAVTAVLGSHVNVQGCFYHLTQSTLNIFCMMHKQVYIIYIGGKGPTLGGKCPGEIVQRGNVRTPVKHMQEVTL